MMGGKGDIDPTGGYIIFRFAITEQLSAHITGAVISNLVDVYVDGIVQAISKNKNYDFSVGEHEVKWILNTTIVKQNDIPEMKTSNNSGIFTKAELLLPSTLTEIEKFALRSSPAYIPTTAYSYAKVPPIVGTAGIGLWYLNASQGRFLYVPKGSGDAYKAASGWSSFKGAVREMS